MLTGKVKRTAFVILLLCVFLWPYCFCMSSTDSNRGEFLPGTDDPNLSELANSERIRDDYETKKTSIAESEIIVRVFEDWRDHDGGYIVKKGPLIIGPTDGVDLSQFDIEPGVLFLISGFDQTNDALKEILGSFVFAGIGGKTQLGLESFLRGKSLRGSATIRDAVGVPMSGAKVRLHLAKHKGPVMIELCDVRLDSQGRMLNPLCSVDKCQIVLTASHPDWADGLETTVPYFGNMEHRYAPVIRNDNGFADRGIWGRVSDPNGAPIPGAKIHNTSVMSVWGSHIRTQNCTIYTDADGRFYYYPIVKKSNLGTEVPYDSKYYVEITAPPKYDLVGYRGNILNGRESNISLERGDAFKTLVFTDANGPVTDSERLSRIRLHLVNEKGGYEPVEFACWKDGTYLRYGKYVAKGYWGRESFDFETMFVTADSPDELVFVPERPYENIPENIVTYHGRVIDGITGKGMAGVFVVTAGWTKRDFADITDEQWSAIENLGDEPEPDDEAFLPFRKKWSVFHEPVSPPFKVLVRSNEEGYFNFAWFKKDHIEFVVAFARGYLTDKRLIDSMSRETKYPPDENNAIYIPDMRMYQSGVLRFSPVVDIPKLDLRIRPDFRVTEGMSWSEDFIDWYRSHRFSLAERNLRKHESVEMLVPAGIDFRLRMKIADEGRAGDPWWCGRYTDYLRVEPGKTLDLGGLEIDREIPVFVMVLDSSDRPVDSVTVSHLKIDKDHSQGLGHITDSNGMAMFYVPPVFEGRFSVLVRGKDPETGKNTIILRQDIRYETTGSGNANRVFELVLSNEILVLLFGGK